MRTRSTLLGGASLLGAALLLLTLDGLAADREGEPANDTNAAGKATVSVEEARGRARLLHEVIRGALQVMHRDFFDPDDKDRIPSSSLEDMFDGVKEAHGVELRWLGVNAKVMDIDHKARDEFEKKAVAALDGGEWEYESVEGERFRFAGAIRLHNACLKCHVPFRKSLETRKAGLVINIPIQAEDNDAKPKAKPSP